MKVAIIGAGLAGLSCAHELLRHGITPTIFEKKGYIGEALDFPAVLLRIFNSTKIGTLKHIENEFKIKIQHHYELKNIEMVSSKKSYVVKGSLGKMVKRGRYPDSFLNQIAKSIDAPIVFDTYAETDDIKKDFDRIVVASGNPIAAIQFGLFNQNFFGVSRIATILGNFRLDTLKAWLNTNYFKQGYAYIVPESKKEARLIMVVDNITHQELDYYWDKFIQSEKINYTITNLRDVEHIVGIVEPQEYKNIYFTGISGGFIDSFLGFGTLKAILSGAIAGNCIAKNLDYNKEIKYLVKDSIDKHEFRKAINSFDDKDFDLLFKAITLPGIKHFIYNNPCFKLNQGVFIAKMLNKIRDNH